MPFFQIHSDSNDLKIDSIPFDADSIVDSAYFGIPNQQDIPFRSVESAPKTNIEVKKEDYLPQQKVKTVESWQTITLVFTLFLVGFVRAFNTNRTLQSIRALFNYVVAQEIVREEKVFFHRSNLVLTLVHVLNTSLFIHYVIQHYGQPSELSGFYVFLMLIGAITLMYMLKYLFSKVLFFVLEGSNLAIEYIFSTCLYNNMLGVLLLPILGTAFFTGIDGETLILYLAIPLIALVLVLRLIRLAVIGNTNGVSYLYIFLYLCTLEILPLVVLYRIFIQE